MKQIITLSILCFTFLTLSTSAQVMTLDTVMYINKNNSTILDIPISEIDSITFGVDTSWGGLGNILLPGNTTCDSQYISVAGCDGMTSLTYNGYDYDLIEIGGQCWFKENLQTTTYRDGSPINYHGTNDSIWDIDTIGAYTWYNNDSSTYGPTHGALYNWYSVDNPSGLCPTGWHVPTDCEWMYLENTLGMSIGNQDSTGFRGTDEGDMLKDTTLWGAPITGMTNSSGFKALPSGSGGAGYYSYIDIAGFWWTSNENHSIYSWRRLLDNSYSNIYRGTFYKRVGQSVRCIKD